MGTDVPLFFRVLGPIRVERSGAPISVGSPQRRAVLGLLLLNAEQVVSFDRLTDWLWGDEPPASCRVQLQSAISGLRQVLGDGERASAPIETHPSGYRLRLRPGQTDVEHFHQEVAAARDRIAAGDLAAARELLRTALGRWYGSPFAGIDCQPVRAAAAGLADARLGALEDRIETDLALGRHDEVLAELVSLVAEHPNRERFRGQLMVAYSQAGRLVEALDVYRQTRAHLVAELGVEPSVQLQQLYRAIITGYTTTHDVDPLSAHPYVIPRQLPADVPDLVGRDNELTAAMELIAAGRTRLAFTGPGGIGKTALTLRLAHQLREAYPDGQLYARLGGAGSRVPPADVLARLLHALGVPPGGVPDDQDERGALYRDLLATRRVLILLDDAADEGQLRPLLPAEPRCALLITSRRRTAGLETVTTVPVDVLTVESGRRLLGALAGAERADAEPAAAAEVVRHCGGLPLALRIAGMRLRTRPNWSVADLAGRLRASRDRLDWLDLGDLGVRTSLMNTYETLPGPERRLLRRLGLLRVNEFPAWLAGALLDTEAGHADRVLDDLAEIHLVEPAGRGVTGPRYRLHDLIHLLAGELATEELDADRRAAVGRVLGGWLDLAAAADRRIPHWHGRDPEPPPRWRAPAAVRAAVAANPVAWFDEERSPLARFVGQAADEGHAGAAWPLAQRMSAYLDIRGSYDEWAAILRDGLRAAEEAGDNLGTACMLGLLIDVEANRDQVGESVVIAARGVAMYQSLGATAPVVPEEPVTRLDHRPELDELDRELAQARAAGDPLAVGFAAFRLVLARRDAGEQGGYLPLFEEARAAFAACGARVSELWTLKNIGLTHLKQRRFADAERTLLRAGEVIASMGDSVTVGDTTADMARTWAAEGKYAEAEKLTVELLDQARLRGHRWDEGRALDTLAELRQERGDHHGAVDAHLAALVVWRHLGTPARVARTNEALTELCDQIAPDA